MARPNVRRTSKLDEFEQAMQEEGKNQPEALRPYCWKIVLIYLATVLISLAVILIVAWYVKGNQP